MNATSRIAVWLSEPGLEDRAGPEARRRDVTLAVGVGLLFLVVRGAHLVWAWRWPLGGDSIDYDRLASLLVEGKPWVNWSMEPDWQFGPFGSPTAVRSPGLPLFLASLYAVFGHEPHVGRVALVLLNACAAGLLYDAGRRVASRISGLVASLSWTFWPVSVRALYYVDSLLAESLAIPAVIVAIWALSLETRRGALLAGAAAGVAILSRGHLAPALPFFLVGSLIVLRHDSKAVARALIATLAAAIVMAPWLLRNAAVFGSFIPLTSQGGLGIWAGWVEGASGSWDDSPTDKALVENLARTTPTIMTGTEPEKSSLYFRAGREAMVERGIMGSLAWGAWKLWLYFRPWETGTGFHFALLICTLLAVASFRASRSLPGLFCFAVWLGIGATSIITYYLGRYRVVSTPAVVLLATLGLEQLTRRAWRQRARQARGPPPHTSEQRDQDGALRSTNGALAERPDRARSLEVPR